MVLIEGIRVVSWRLIRTLVLIGAMERGGWITCFAQIANDI